MPIKLGCPCKARLSIADHLAGKRVRCPKCKRIHSVPRVGMNGTPTTNSSPERLQFKSTAPSHFGRFSEPTIEFSAKSFQAALAQYARIAPSPPATRVRPARPVARPRRQTPQPKPKPPEPSRSKRRLVIALAAIGLVVVIASGIALFLALR